MQTTPLLTAVFIAISVLSTGCANTDHRPSSPSYYGTEEYRPASPSYYGTEEYRPASPSYYSAEHGVIEAIDVMHESSGIGGSGIGAGAVIGGVVGGVLGHQVGEGRGKDAATVIGAVGGAVAGHQIEKSNRQQQDAYRIRVRLDRGGYQTLTQQSIGDMRVGDRVRVENDSVSRY